MTISAIDLNEKAEQFVSVSNLPDITTNSRILTANSNTNIGGSITSWTKPHISLQKSDGNYIDVDDIITKKDMTSTTFLWESLFLAICQKNPLKAPEYMTTLKLYNDDYKKAVIAIETAAIPE